MDGYSITEACIAKKYFDMQNLLDEQLLVNKQMMDLHNEMETMPKIPFNLENWIDSVSDQTDDKSFKISDYSNMFVFKKRYDKLVERKDQINRLLKIAVIDNLIDRIKSVK